MISEIKQPENNFTYSALYDLERSEKNKVGQNLEKIHGYIAYDGTYHQADNVVGDAYENYPGYCFSEPTKNPITENTCNDQPDCIGLFEYADKSTFKIFEIEDGSTSMWIIFADGQNFAVSPETPQTPEAVWQKIVMEFDSELILSLKPSAFIL